MRLLPLLRPASLILAGTLGAATGTMPALAQEKENPTINAPARSRPQPAQPAQVSPQEQASMRKIEDYLNSVTTLSARFEQVDSAGKRATGRFFISKPGKLRFEYDPPVPVLIVTNGHFLIHYDRALKTASYISQETTPAWFLTTPRIQLSGDITVTDMTRRDGKLLLSIVKTREPGQGKVTLIFDEDPIRLEQWAVTDPQGVVTHVTLNNVLVGGPVDPKLFEFNEPTWDGMNK